VIVIPASFLIAFMIGRLGEMTRQHEQEAVERQRDLSKNDTYVRFMTLLNEIVRASLEAEDMPTLLNVLVTQTGTLFSADECFITRWDEAGKTTIPVMAYGPESQTYNSLLVEPGKRTLTSAVLEAGHVLVVEDVANTPYIDPASAPPPRFMRSALGLPLITRGQKLGALILGFDQPHQFSPEEVERGELAARQISLAMTKVLLLEEAQSRVRELAGLHRISQTFTLHGDDRQIYGMLTEILAGLMGTEICILSLYDETSRELRAQVPAYNLGDEVVAALHFPVNTGGRSWSITEGKA
jgi:transcriptional regulator with GAF, ATPase, and Fis domain